MGRAVTEPMSKQDIDSLMKPVVDLWQERRTREGSSDAVYGTLREAILSKALTPGPQLAEEDLARVFGVSRTPIREAILRLETERLVERSSGRRVAVARISPAEILEIYDVRVALDGVAAELATQRATPPDIAQLRWINEKMIASGQAGDYAGVSALSLDFHDWIAKASGNGFLLSQIRVVHDRVRRFERTTLQHPGRLGSAAEEHERLLDAIASGDVDRATSLARAHMLNAKKIRLAMAETPPD
ncbi:GntR family transcriptional regulator [Asanoa iriomotensis]|uniref:GntR family transcriptional regulator n=2 Tax=Asanoa iriomotensis TaxID=234613 RepID=A0ABQ4C078_9ACTN|nr:GntR family transcriptional regulator [Asanoa iriomotensis]